MQKRGLFSFCPQRRGEGFFFFLTYVDFRSEVLYFIFFGVFVLVGPFGEEQERGGMPRIM